MTSIYTIMRLMVASVIIMMVLSKRLNFLIIRGKGDLQNFTDE